MPKKIVPLSATKIDKAKPQEKDVKMYDGGGLYLLISPSGGKLWYLKYRFGDKEKKLALGPYPTLTLDAARKRREEAKKFLLNGVDPGAMKQVLKSSVKDASANTFELVAREWHHKFSYLVSRIPDPLQIILTKIIFVLPLSNES